MCDTENTETETQMCGRYNNGPALAAIGCKQMAQDKVFFLNNI